MIKYDNLIGEGAEARVYKYKDKAVKIFKKDVSDTLSKRLCGLKLDRIVTPIELLYEDDKFIGYIMDYVESTDEVTKVKKSDFLDSMLMIKCDISVLSKNNVLAGDLIPKNSILSNNSLYFVDTSLYRLNDVGHYVNNLRINDQMLELYIKSLVCYSTGSLEGKLFLQRNIKDFYSIVTSEMKDEETMDVFAKRLVKEKQLQK